MKFSLSIFAALIAVSTFGRSYSFKLVGSGGKSGEKEIFFQDKSKHIVGELTIGRPGPKEDLSPLQIRAATVFKDIRTRKAFVNDITTAVFTSTNSATSRATITSGAAGKMVDHDAKTDGGYDFSRGYTVAGIIVEIWQRGKCVKHLSNLSGKDGKTLLADGTYEMLLNEDDIYELGRRKRTAAEIEEYKADGFDNPTKILLAE